MTYDDPDILIQGSETVSRDGNILFIPVFLPLHVGDDDPPEGQSEVLTMACRISRGPEAVSCHTCEGGHHVHILWEGEGMKSFYNEFAAYFPGYRVGATLDVQLLEYEVGVETRLGYILAVRAPMEMPVGWAVAWITAGHVYAST